MRHILPLLLLLGACTQMVDGGEGGALKTEKSIRDTGEALRNLFTYERKPTALKAIPSTYCYRVMQDIVCYRDPQPGAEARLVAYQGTVAVAPPIPTPAEVKKTVATAPELFDPKPQPVPEPVLPKLKPVYVMPPPPVKEAPAS